MRSFLIYPTQQALERLPIASSGLDFRLLSGRCVNPNRRASSKFDEVIARLPRSVALPHR
jgi:hypothetical protein